MLKEGDATVLNALPTGHISLRVLTSDSVTISHCKAFVNRKITIFLSLFQKVRFFLIPCRQPFPLRPAGPQRSLPSQQRPIRLSTGYFSTAQGEFPASRQPSLKRCNRPIFGSICTPIFILHHLPGIPGFLPQQNANKGFAKNTCRPPSILISYFYPFYQQIVSKKHDIFVK